MKRTLASRTRSLLLSSLAAAAVTWSVGCYVQPPPPAGPQSPPAPETGEVAPTYAEAAAQPAVEVAPSGNVYQLRYAWQRGDVRRFRYHEAADIRSSMGMGGDMAFRLDVASELVLRVLEVERDGWAKVSLELQAFTLSSAGQSVLNLAAIPDRARVVTAWISPRGEIVFANDVFVVMGESAVRVVISDDARRSRAEASARATARIGDQTFSIAASVSADGGTVTAGAQLSARDRVTHVRDEDTTLDVIPRELLRMIVLPDDALAVGGRVAMTTPLGNATVTVRELGQGQLGYDTAMTSSMGGVQDVAADIHTVVASTGSAAVLTRVDGNVSMTMDVGGMRQTVRHTFELKSL